MQQHFEVIILSIVAVSVAPAFIAAVKGALASRQGTKRGKHEGLPPVDTTNQSDKTPGEER